MLDVDKDEEGVEITPLTWCGQVSPVLTEQKQVPTGTKIEDMIISPTATNLFGF
jgi:hypothetical protein